MTTRRTVRQWLCDLVDGGERRRLQQENARLRKELWEASRLLVDTTKDLHAARQATARAVQLSNQRLDVLVRRVSLLQRCEHCIRLLLGKYNPPSETREAQEAGKVLQRIERALSLQEDAA